MKHLITNDVNLTITLKEITDLISVEHNKAMKIVDKLTLEPSFGTVEKIATVYNSKGQTVDTYILNKKQAIASGAKLNNTLLMKVIDRLEELEKERNLPQLPQNYIEALEALTIAEKEKLQLSNTIQEKDKVILAVADLNIKAGDVSISEFSKNLAIPELGRNNLFKWLRARGFIMMNGEPYQPYITRKYFVMKPYEEKYGGETKYKLMLTPKGTVWLTKILRAEFELDEAVAS